MDDLLDICFEGLSVRPVTMSLVEDLMLDQPLSPEAIVDFGVHTKAHYTVLQMIVQDACAGWSDVEDEEGYGLLLLDLHRVIVQLDRAARNGEKLNALVKTYVPECRSMVRFHTTWDELLGRQAESVEETSAKAKA